MPISWVSQYIRTVAVAGVAAVALTSAAIGATGTDASAAPAPDSTTRATYVITLRDQVHGLPAKRATITRRAAVLRRAQNSVLDRLSGAAPTHVVHLSVGNTVAARVTLAQAAQLRTDPAVASVVANMTVSAPAPEPSSPPRGARAAAPPTPLNVPASACTGTKAKPQLEPEALQTIGARSQDPADPTAASLKVDGSGVTVGLIADGIDPANGDFIRPDGSRVITRYVDVGGSGPEAKTSGDEAFGDASAIAAQGRLTYDLADFSSPKVIAYPGGHCYVHIVGVAPGANVVAVKADDNGFTDVSLLQAIDYAVSTAHVNVLNESLGGSAVPDASRLASVQAANAAAVAAGTTVVVSSGDAGVNSTIGTPGAQSAVIRVGATTSSRGYVQTGKGSSLSAENPDSTWRSDAISPISSSGFTQQGATVDLVAPGDANWSACQASARFSGCTNLSGQGHSPLQLFAGTSQSSPMTAGTAALVIAAYRSTHGGATPTPAVVKQILTGSADDLGLPGTLQGAGRLDAYRAVQAARSWSGGTAGPAALLPDPGQVTVAGSPGSTHTATIAIRNAGTAPAAATLRTRHTVVTGTVTRDIRLDANAATSAITGDFGGVFINAQNVALDVPAGTDLTTVNIAWPNSTTKVPIALLTLYAPDGTFLANSNPQDYQNPDTGAIVGPQYASLTIRTPKPGRYTAKIWTLHPAGIVGTVHFGAQFRQQVSADPITPNTTTVAPGATASATVAVRIPTVGGDTSEDAVITTPDGRSAVVPILVRSVLPVQRGSAAIAGIILGGNGRPQSPVQTFTYAADVPSGHRDLSVELSWTCGCQLEGLLVDPAGLIQSDAVGVRGTGANRVLSLTAARPVAGRWRLVLLVDSVPGTSTSSPLRGSAALDRTRVSAPGLPDDASRVLTTGVTTRTTVRVTNTTPTPLTLQADPRLEQQVTKRLIPSASTFDYRGANAGTELLVPPDTSDITATVTSSRPVVANLVVGTGGGISVVATPGSARADTTVVHLHGARLPIGPWGVLANAVGPFSAPEQGRASVRAEAVMSAFDPSVTTATSDYYREAVMAESGPDPSLSIAAGQTADLLVSIRPNAAVGTLVRGHLNLVQTPDGGNGGVYAQLPYTYRVGAVPAAHRPAARKPAPLAATGPSDAPRLAAIGILLVLAGGLLTFQGARGRKRFGRHSMRV